MTVSAANATCEWCIYMNDIVTIAGIVCSQASARGNVDSMDKVDESQGVC